MQFRKTLVRLLLFLLPVGATAQTTYFTQGDKANILIERLEIKAGRDSVLNFSKTRPLSRKQIIPVIEKYRQAGKLVKSAGEISPTLDEEVQRVNRVGSMLTPVDLYNAERVLMGNSEWTTQKFTSKKPFLKNFYTSPPNLFEVHVKDFDLVINPVIQFVISKEKDSDEKLFLNTRGLNLRGRIANKIGFFAYLTDNQERDPGYVRQWVTDRRAVPGEGLYKAFKGNAYDYFDARGYFTFNVTKYIDVAFGYDKNFIGNGYRSMFLSDFGNNNLFLKLNTRIWKINYQNLFMELHSAAIPGTGDKLVPKKYAAIHHLDVDVTKSLNIGLFEAVIFGREDHFDFGYLNPIIFYRSIEQQNGSFDNSLAGLDFKANIARRVQVYGQFCLDEFLLSEIKKNRGWWANKWGIQLGAKYIDAFGIKNLDLQLEHNRARPFTYSHFDSVGNYTHYNQPMAHPLMANFKEFIGIARYQPVPKWMAVAKLIYYQQGRDSGSQSFGSNIFLPNGAPYRIGDFGYNIGSGWKTDVFYASLLLSYELRENLFLELMAVSRKLDTKTAPIVSQKTSIISFGVRWNMHRREFDY
jgi:hypothetical protein